MRRQISNQEQFKEKLELLGNLYEEGKDCLNRIFIPPGHELEKDYLRLFDILREMRDIAAVNMQGIHWIDEN